MTSKFADHTMVSRTVESGQAATVLQGELDIVWLGKAMSGKWREVVSESVGRNIPSHNCCLPNTPLSRFRCERDLKVQ